MSASWMAKERAWIGDGLIAGRVTGIIVDFHGLGCTGRSEDASQWEKDLALRGILSVFPYYGPWSWMNREARAFVDELIDKVCLEYGAGAEIPLLLSGGSMGGGSALIFARYTRHPLTACAVNCPVCDFPYHFTERPDVARTMYHAFGHYPIPIKEALVETSPLHQVGGLPDIPYFFIHGEADQAVNKAAHSDKMVRAMRARELRVEYHEVPGMGHCGPVPEEISVRERDFLQQWR
jgi:pimeloyl-ACP methyl ester carboxylesterase